jgi:hypothetical protein
MGLLNINLWSLSMRCPHCGAGNPRENRFCLECSKSLSTDGAINSGLENSAFSSAPSQTLPLQTMPPQNGATPSSVQSAPVPSSASATQSSAEPGAQASTASSANYKPSGKFGSSAPILLLVATLLGAPLIGLLYSFVAQYMNLLLVSQLVAGALIGGLLALAIKTGKCRNSRMAIACGVVGGLLLFSTYLFANSMRARNEFINILGPMLLSSTKGINSPGKPIQLSASQAREMMSQKLPPLRFFSVYLRENAEAGVTLRSSHSSSSSTGGFRVQGPGTGCCWQQNWVWSCSLRLRLLSRLRQHAFAKAATSGGKRKRCIKLIPIWVRNWCPERAPVTGRAC